MSEDEIIVMAAAFAVGPVAWLIRLATWMPLRGAGVALRTIGGTLLLCGAMLVAVLATVAASDVVHAPGYIFMYAVLGLAWMRVAEAGFAFAGLSIRDDGIERRNAAARVAGAGAIIGIACCYAGANIGEGPGWWVVLFSAALATAAWFACWLALGG